MRKKRVLFVTESSKLASGFGEYGKQIVRWIFDTNKYKIAELTCYSSSTDFEDTDWPIYGVAPIKGEDEYAKLHNSNPAVQWGVLRFEHVCHHFRPDIVACYRDPWMDAYIADSPYLPFFNWVWMPTVDSAPQKQEWLYMFNRCDALLAYSEFGIRTLEQQTHSRLKPIGCASPAINYDVFDMMPNKEKHKEKMGVPSDSLIFGTVMRNQKRKMFAELMRAFRMFLNEAPENIASKSYLLLHTSYPEKMGWDITGLAHEFGIASRVLVTYICRHCKKYFCSIYRDAITKCDHCGHMAATMPCVSNGIPHDELSNIYNVMDLYIQYAICLGKDEEIKIRRNNKEMWMPISKVKVGDEAWTHKCRWQPVLSVFKNLPKSHNKRVMEVSVYGDYETLVATEDHEFLAYTRKELPKSRSVREDIGRLFSQSKDLPKYGTYELAELKQGDILLYPIDDTVVDINKIDIVDYLDGEYKYNDTTIFCGQSEYPRYIDIDKEFCRFIGLFAADGSITAGSTCRVTCHKAEHNNHRLCNSIFNRLKSPNNIVKEQPYHNRNAIDYNLYSRVHGKVFYKWFKKNEHKCLPDWCMKLPPEKQKEIVIGMFMGDGSYCESKNYSSFSNTSKPLVEQLKCLLNRLRVPYAVSKTKRSQQVQKDNRNRKDIYNFEIYKCNIKKGELNTNNNSAASIYYKNYRLIKIKDVKEIDYNDDVWCVEVDIDHTITSKLCMLKQCEGFGLPVIEAAACGTPIATVYYSAIEDLANNLAGYKIQPILQRELETNADRSVGDNDSLVKVMLQHAKKSKSEINKLRIQTRKRAMKRYTWEQAAKMWEKVFDSLPQKGNWNTPRLIQRPPDQIPPNMTNSQFAEWICLHVIQDPYHLYNYKMLQILKSLNFGVNYSIGHLEACDREKIYNEAKAIADRRYNFDAVRCGDIQWQMQPFIQEAERRVK